MNELEPKSMSDATVDDSQEVYTGKIQIKEKFLTDFVGDQAKDINIV